MTGIVGGFCRMSGAQVSGVEISGRHAPPSPAGYGFSVPVDSPAM